MFISKKKFKNYIEKLQAENRAANLGQNYDQPISKEQASMNMYLQGYEDGTDNFFNAICSKFNIRSKAALPYTVKENHR